MSASNVEKNSWPQMPQMPQMPLQPQPQQPIYTDKEAMLRKISACQIMVLDIALYLDTHWNDTAMINKHNFYAEMLGELIEEYETMFKEPLSIYGMSPENRWTWIDGKWPWERCDRMGGDC